MKFMKRTGSRSDEQQTITPDDINQSYDLLALIRVCYSSAQQLQDDLSGRSEIQRDHVDIICALTSTLRIVYDKAGECHDVLEGAEKRDRLEAEKVAALKPSAAATT